MEPARFASFREFYPYYLQQHTHRTSRRLHIAGTLLALLVATAALVLGRWGWLLAAPLCGYGFAWVGHFFFEHNRPATFSHPLYSLAGDWVMYAQMLTGRIRW